MGDAFSLLSLSEETPSLKQTWRAPVGGGVMGSGGGGHFPLAFVVLVPVKGPRLNWTYWPTNRGSVPTERPGPDNVDPRPGRWGGGGGGWGGGEKQLRAED